tara:strand:- start:1254 stop:1571 length:318 start_codon:yes stop_codon:yes gene_type:complete
MEITIILLVLSDLISLYVIYNLYNKNEQYEQTLQELESDQTDLSNYLFDVYETIKAAHTKITQLDIKGSFEADDEVGFFFNDLKEITEELESMFELLKEDNDKEN